jgi:acetyl esterase/lipase
VQAVSVLSAGGLHHRPDKLAGMAEVPGYLRPFVLHTDACPRERLGTIDLYLPAASGPRPAVLFVHGGPILADLRPTPRDWPAYVGYGQAAAARGAIGVTVDHRLHSAGDFETAAADVAAAAERARADPRVDPGRLALWFFSGGGLLLTDWLRDPPGWLRCVAATYPVLAATPDAGVDPRFRPAAALAGCKDLPVVLTRAGLERPWIAATVTEFVAAASKHGTRLELIDVPNGHHGFDTLDHTDESRRAVEQALDTVLRHLNPP